MKKKLKIMLVGLIVLLGIYFMGDWYYAHHFGNNSSFAGVEIGNTTIETAEAKLIHAIQNHQIRMTEGDKEWGSILLRDLDPDIQIRPQLEAMLAEQNQSSWLVRLVASANETEETLTFNLTIAPQALNDAIQSLDLMQVDRELSQDAQIDYDENQGFYIRPEETGNVINEEKLTKKVHEAILNGDTTFDLSSTYQEPELKQSDQELQTKLEQLKKYEDLHITLLIAGYEESITADQILSWMYFDEYGDIYFDQQLIYEYLGVLNDYYATYDDYRYFESTMQGTVQLLPGTLGWSIDREAETQAILNDLYAGISVVREPAIVGVGYNGTLDDVTDSYIEVDMSYQMMFLYLDGQLILSTPIVTGQIGTDTVPGAYAIWNKESPSELVGYNPRTEKDYVQPVEYWMAFDDTGQGIHDASWQPYFGGDAYLTNGSLGCVNTPPDIMATFYDYAYLGMPVIVFE